MVVVGADDQRLVPKHRVAPRQEADHVTALEPRHVGVLGHRRVTRDGKRLEPAAGRGLQADRFEPAREVGRRGVGARASREAAAEPVVAQEPDVVQREHRRDDGARHVVLGGPHLLSAQWRCGAQDQKGERDGEGSYGHTVESYHAAQRGTKSGPGGSRRTKAARRRAVRSRSSNAIISLGLCMYRLGTDTSAVATPRWALKMASASVCVSRDAASMVYGMLSATAVSTSISKTSSLTDAPREMAGPPPSR